MAFVSWVKLDDQFFSHPKARESGRDGALLFLAGLTYCARHLTDGRIPKSAVPIIAAEAWAKPAAARKLVEVGLWHDKGDHYEAHDYLDRNPTRAKVLSDREAARERAANGGRTSRKVPPNSADVSVTPVPVPDLPTEDVKARKRATKPPKDFAPTDEHCQYAQDHGLDVTAEAEHWLVHCEAKGITYQVVNAGFATWLHQAVKFGRGNLPIMPVAPFHDEPRRCRECSNTGNVIVDGVLVKCEHPSLKVGI